MVKSVSALLPCAQGKDQQERQGTVMAHMNRQGMHCYEKLVHHSECWHHRAAAPTLALSPLASRSISPPKCMMG